MGAWGTGPFDNDSASDIMWDIRESSLAEWLQEINPDDIDDDEGSGVVAVAALITGVKPEFFDEDDTAAWNEILSHVSDDQRQHVKSLLNVVLTPGKSELYELWEETGVDESFTEWFNQSQKILNQL